MAPGQKEAGLPAAGMLKTMFVQAQEMEISNDEEVKHGQNDRCFCRKPA